MTLPVRVHPLARQDIRHVIQWYRERNAEVASRFVRRLTESLRSIAEAPLRHRLLKRGMRRMWIPGFSIAVYDRVGPDRVTVVGVIHGRRRPRTWMVRETPPVLARDQHAA